MGKPEVWTPYYCVSLLAANDTPNTQPPAIPNPSGSVSHGAGEPFDDTWWQNWNNAAEME